MATTIWLGILFGHSTCYAQTFSAKGFNTEITSVTIPVNRRPVVTFKISDGKGRPLELEDLDIGSIRFTIAAIKAETSGETR